MSESKRKIEQRDYMLDLAVFLFCLEEEKGYHYIYGGVELGKVIDGFCKFSNIKRELWEGIVWPDKVMRRPSPGKIV